jgi:GNAT superfamily N-acetyltransferase
MEMNLELKQLAECPEHFETVGHWIYEQWWKTPDNTPEVLLKQLRPHLEKGTFPYTIVAMIDGGPVGSCCVIENDCSLRPQYSPWVAAVYVKPEKRLQGVASGILQKAFHIAKKLRIKGLYIDCWAKTSPLYKKNGWKILERDVGQKDSLVMYRSTGSVHNRLQATRTSRAPELQRSAALHE